MYCPSNKIKEGGTFCLAAFLRVEEEFPSC